HSLCSNMRPSLALFFFFQAEDGIRAFHVTGVQTCALPISILVEGLKRLEYRGYDSCGVALYADGQLQRTRSTDRVAELEREIQRSEERRVGKECGSERAPGKYKKEKIGDEHGRQAAWLERE